ncbi:MAG: T9SS type A sorting domain-containing protein [Bacteroidota bacterium]
MKSFLCYLFVFIPICALFGQHDGCISHSLSASEMQVYQDAINALDNSGQIVMNSDETFSIPIHLYISQNMNGDFPLGKTQDEIEALFISSLNFVNEALGPRVTFYIVERDVLMVPQTIFKNRNPMTISNYFNNNLPNNEGVNTNTLNIFITEIDIAQAAFPFGVSIGGGNTNGRWLLHELGHYFGLFHTWQFSFNTFNPFLYPNGSPTFAYPTSAPLHNDANSIYCDNVTPGLCYGDYIESTPPDFRDAYGNDLDEDEFTPDQEFSLFIWNDPMEYTYNPDFFNVMSYWNVGATVLNQEQKDRIYNVIKYPGIGVPPFGGDMTFLIDDDVPVVNYQPPSLEMFRQSSDIQIVQFPAGGGEEFMPYFQGRIPLIYQGNTPPTVHQRPYVGKGLLKMNTLIPFDQVGADIRYNFTELSEGCEDLDFYDDTHVNVLDAAAIQKHILGIEYLDSPFKYIAADVTNQGAVNVISLVNLLMRIRGVKDRYTVPDFQFMPRYLLENDAQFNMDFYADPFTAALSYHATTYDYLGTNGINSYLGDKAMVATEEYVKSHSIPFYLDDPIVQNIDNISLIAIRSGDLVQENSGQGNLACSTPSFSEIFSNNPTLDKNMDHVIRLSFDIGPSYPGLDLTLQPKGGTGIYFSEINGVALLGPSSLLSDVSSDLTNIFIGSVRSKQDVLNAIVLPSSLANDVGYFEFTISGLTEDTPLADLVEISCLISGEEEKGLKSNGKQPQESLVKLSNQTKTSTFNQHSYTEQIMIFPNPTKDFVNVKIGASYFGRIQNIEIVNIYGEVVKNLVIDKKDSLLNISLADLLDGSYLLKFILTNGEVETKKLIRN